MKIPKIQENLALPNLVQDLSYQQQMLQDLIGHVPGIVWEAWGKPDAANQRINFVSDFVEKLLGYTVDEWLAHPNFWLTIVHPEDRRRAAAEAAAIFESGKGGISEFRWVTKEGKTIWVEAHSRVICDENGRPVGMRGVTMDITKRRVTQEQLNETTRRVGHILESIADAFISFDRDWRFTYINKHAERFTGRPAEELIGKLAPQEYPDFTESNFFKKYKQAMETQKVMKFEAYYPSLESWYQVNAYPSEKGLAVYFSDITQKKQAEEALQKSKQRLELAQKACRIGSFEWNIQTDEIVWTSELESLYGLDSGTFAGKYETWSQRIHPEDRARAEEEVRRSARQGSDLDTEYRIIWPDQSIRWIAIKATVYRNHKGEPLRMIGINMDITEQKNAEEIIRHQAFHDALTDLPNRLLLQDRLSVALQHAKRSREMIAVIFLDLDHFKNINDTLGHQAGDILLQETAKRLRSCVRGEDTVARFGGDEFLIMLTNLKSPQDAIVVTEKIFEALKPTFTINDEEIHINASMGIALYPGDGKDETTLIKNADTALYRAKEFGRNTYQLYLQSMNLQSSKRFSLENSLRKGLERKEFSIYYQPIYSADGRLLGSEALLRWSHPEMGLILPGEFIPIAEETGLILPLGEWVITTVCEQLVAWGKHVDPHLAVSLNLSARQFSEVSMGEMISSCLAAHQIDPKRLTVEITESIAMQNTAITIPRLRELKSIGVNIAIDDFGIGHSSLNYLKQFPIDELKIDKSFIKNCCVDERDIAIIKAIITLGHTLKLKVVAEGIEEKGQQEALIDLGCDQLQGFFISPPLSPSAFAAWCEEQPHLPSSLPPKVQP